jgi:glycosyltransferase involved in cell wall biosynthesis
MTQVERDETEICQRWQKFLSSNSHLVEGSVVKINLQEILRAFQAEKILDEKLLVQIFYISTGWLPNKIEVQELIFANMTGGLIAVEKKIKEQYEFFKNRFSKRSIDFVSFPVGTTFIDITHTLKYPFNTGIQRVVRNIGTNLISNSSFEFVKWDLDLGGWVSVDKEIVRNHLPFKKNGVRIEKGNVSFLPRFLKDIKKFSAVAVAALWHGLFSSYRFLLASEDSSKILEKKIVRKILNFLKGSHKSTNVFYRKKSHVVQSPMLIGQQIFVVEPIQNIEIVLAHEYFHHIGDLSVLVYDLLPISNPEYFPQTSIQGFSIYLKLLSFANKILTISEFTKQQVSKYCDLKQNVVLKSQLLPGQEISIQNNNAQKMASKLVLSVGSIEPRKNQMSLLHASELLWSKGLDFKVVVVGGQGWKNREILNFKNILQLRGRNLEFKNDLSDETLSGLFKACNLVVTIPWIEGFGLPLAEALSYKKQVIASDISSHREITHDFNVFWVDPGDILAIARAIESALLQNPSMNHTYQTNLPKSWHDYSESVAAFLTSSKG